MQETKWKDPRKNIYTVTVATMHGRVAIIETYSSKKLAEEQLARLTSTYVLQNRGGSDDGQYRVAMHTTKLQRKSRI